MSERECYDGEHPIFRHRSEQKRTFSQSRAHFRRQVNGLPQATQTFVAEVSL